MPIEDKYKVKSSAQYKDVRALHVRVFDWFSQADNATYVYAGLLSLLFLPSLVPHMWQFQGAWDIIALAGGVYAWWYHCLLYTSPSPRD